MIPEAKLLNSYDEVPYQSYPYTLSRPENLRTIGVLFNMNPPAIETARVLELGCAEGGNIIPLAVSSPNASFVGVDLSKVQIDAGNIHVKTLGLKNIELKNCSIMDIDEKFGMFDYIICHGVISWVPAPVREKILQIVNKNLTENGIAYISYNTLPGWNMVRTMRDMMLYHSKSFVNPQDKVSQSKLLLNFVKESLEGENSIYSDILKQETDLIQQQSDYYLHHEYLEEENKQFYFSEFMDLASKSNLQYLGDCMLPSMYVGNIPKNAIEKLQNINDIVRTEQYMDFITNRRFRSTLLCHKNIPLNRRINNEDIKKFTLYANIQPEKNLTEVDLNNEEDLKFFLNNNKNQYINLSTPSLKAVLYVLAENLNNPLAFDELVKKANSKFKDDINNIIEKDLIDNAMNLVIKGFMNLALISGNKDRLEIQKPKLSDFIIYQVTKTNYNWITNHLHMPISISTFDKFLMPYMNGENNKDQIIKNLLDDCRNGKININIDNTKLEDEGKIKNVLDTHYDDFIFRFSHQAVFV